MEEQNNNRKKFITPKAFHKFSRFNLILSGAKSIGVTRNLRELLRGTIKGAAKPVKPKLTVNNNLYTP